ncbi:MAG: ABC transporter permease [Rhodobacteraceae bacterium]|nr:ABC transporter permease [Paracoccaceae bacterium]
MLIVWLAWRDLLRERFFLLCNTAIMVGILVPLLVLFGVKNGVYNALIGEMLRDPANLQIDTAGNASFTDADLAPLRDWPEVAFLTPKVRGQFDYVNVRAANAGQKGGRIKPALMVPSGLGDPTLPKGMSLGPDDVAISAQLGELLGLTAGDTLQIITQADDRPRQLLLDAQVVAVLSPAALSGRAVLAPFARLDLIEAFYDSYSLPDHDIIGTRDLSERNATYAGVRLYARALEELAALQIRIEAQLGISTSARTRDVEALLGLGRKLDLALGLTAALAALGLGGALVLGFWSDVARKKAVLAGIALIGVSGRELALFPVVQALITALLGLVLSFTFYALAGEVAANLFGQGLPEGAALAVISLGQALAICGAVLVLVVGAAAVAGWSAGRLDPASVLREAGA